MLGREACLGSPLQIGLSQVLRVQSIWKFELWRWLMFIAGTVPLYGISRLSLHLLVTGLESHVPHIAKGALYYVVGIRVRLSLCYCTFSVRSNG